MDPYYELGLRDEVIYLHSLWRQGPPRRSTARLPLSNTPQFKKQFPKAKKPRDKKGRNALPQSEPPPVSDVEWPTQETTVNPSSWASNWPILNPAPTPAIQVLSAEEQARFAATQLQQKALTFVEKFFVDNLDSDAEEDNGGNEDDLMDVDGYEEYQFFLKMFTEDVELRGYYEKTCEGGDFCCLVCGGIGKRKIYKDRMALVQHSTATRKTKKAHRAYTQVMCRVLGWDIDRLPTIILTSGDTLGQSLAKLVESQGNVEVAIGEPSVIKKDLALENVNNGEIIQKEVSDVDQDCIVPGTSNVVDANVLLCEGNDEVSIGDRSVIKTDLALENVNNGEIIKKEVSDVDQDCIVPGTSNIVDANVMLCEDRKDNDVGNEVDNNERKIPGMQDRKDNDVGNEVDNNERKIPGN